ncbi:hypothetical protein EB796_015659 [Bugula neritina]|uniref:Copper transport protein n=1 Tax=Bugula neritina TaxID=10212 RepID=A0A7J7JK82_BUGNE|nr:hypothetical protein EB796_015659 [Bugula neritina]
MDDVTMAQPIVWLVLCSILSLVLLCAVVFVVVFLRTNLSCLNYLYFSFLKIKSHKRNTSLCKRVSYHSLATFMKIIDIALGYLLMLAFMLGNVWICLTIVIGSCVSYYFTFWSRIRVRKLRSPQRRLDAAEAEELRTFIVNPSESASHSQNMQFLTAEERKSMEASLLLDGNNMSTFQREQLRNSLVQYDNGDDRSTLPIRPDLITDQVSTPSSPDESLGAARPAPLPFPTEDIDIITKDRSDSNPLLDKYPVLRFHNVDMPDGGAPAPARNSTALEFDELDRMIRELQQT